MSLRLGTKIVAGNAVVVPENIYLKTTYVSGYSGYRIWSDGYCEQWGYCTTVPQTVTFLKIFKNTNYIALVASGSNANAGSFEHPCTISRTKNSMIVRDLDTRDLRPIFWKACGYLAEGQY